MTGETNINTPVALLSGLWRLSSGCRFWLLFAMPFIAVTVAFVVGLPLYYRFMMDDAVVAGNLELLGLMLGGLAVAYLINSASAVTQTWAFSRFSAALVDILRQKMFAKVQRLGGLSGSGEDSASIAAHFGSDLAAIEKWLGQPARVILIHGSVLTVSALMLFVVSWRLALFTYAILPVIAVAMKVVSGPARRHGDRKKQAEAGIVSFVAEEVRTATMLHGFGLRKHRGGQFTSAAENLRGLEGRVAFWGALTGETSIILINLIQIGVFGLGAWLTIRGDMTLGILIAYVGLMINISNAGITLSQLFPQLFDAAAAHGRISRLLEREEGRLAARGSRDPGDFRQIALNAVEFAYRPDQPVLRNVNLTIRAGERVALVGASGSGKSTLLRLILGLEPIGAGSIKINDLDMVELDGQAWLAEIGVVFQQPLLIDGSIADNIRCGRPAADDQALRNAARLAEIHDVVEALPRGYDTPVGEGGGVLSGGQQQRIAIARALIREPSLLVLDEATSALDAATEMALIEMLGRIARPETMIAVTHRLALARAMDRILVLEHGRIVEDGNHEALVAANGLYADLWHKQNLTRQDEDGRESIDFDQLLKLPPLAKLRLPEVLDGSALGRLLNGFVQERFRAGVVIFHGGEAPDAFRVVVRGRVEVFRVNDDGTEDTVAILEEGDCFGEGALLHGTTRMASVRTCLPTQCLSLPVDRFEVAIEEHPRLREVLAKLHESRNPVPKSTG